MNARDVVDRVRDAAVRSGDHRWTWAELKGGRVVIGKNACTPQLIFDGKWQAPMTRVPRKKADWAIRDLTQHRRNALLKQARDAGVLGPDQTLDWPAVEILPVDCRPVR